ncbi:HAD-IIB family hydrolase [Salinimonas chungwhensis]|uniref:HAD-IIB family hydrolase n=1 Tax=Salinimonas chungwhensis TaxID=265425 RepID=UPI000380F644|nr:HAD-IIB family hydrolase [Salinimonas chungwhensis]
MSTYDTLVFTDMDGTLLDHHTYSFEAAKPALTALDNKHIPVIPCTSKTYAEMIELRDYIGLTGPFIIENGAAAFVPHGILDQKPVGTVWQDGFWCKSFTSPKAYWLKLLETIKTEFEGEFTHFSQMDIDAIQQATGLDEASAARAAKRQFGEPVLWLGSEERKAEFIKMVSERGAQPLEGGRFIHISGDCDKGTALKWLSQEYTRQRNTPTRSLALGDGKNDIAMLEAADVAVIIASPNHAAPQVNKQEELYTSTLLGPEGWTEMLTKLLSLQD